MAELLVTRGARINATNRGDDTPLHLAAAHGHKDIVQLVNKQQTLYPSLVFCFSHKKFSLFSYSKIKPMLMLLMNMVTLLCTMHVFGEIKLLLKN